VDILVGSFTIKLNDEEVSQDFSNNLSECHTNSQPLAGADLSIELADKKDRTYQKAHQRPRSPLPLMAFVMDYVIGRPIQWRWQ